MTTRKRAGTTVTKVRKGSYKVTLPKRRPKPVRVDAIPIPIVAYAEVLADGTLGVPNKNLAAWRISKGIYQFEFKSEQIVRSVVVQVHRKPHSPKVLARMSPLSPLLAMKGDLKRVEIAIVNTKFEPVDRPFAIMAITDGAKAPLWAMLAPLRSP